MTKSISTVTAAIYLIVIVGIISVKAYSQYNPSPQENTSQAKKDVDKANADYLKEVAAFKKSSAEKIAANNKSIKDFKARIEKEKSDAKLDYENKIADLDKKNADLKKRLEDYKADGKDQWQKFKEEFNHDLKALGNAFKDLTVRNTK